MNFQCSDNGRKAKQISRGQSKNLTDWSKQEATRLLLRKDLNKNLKTCLQAPGLFLSVNRCFCKEGIQNGKGKGKRNLWADNTELSIGTIISQDLEQRSHDAVPVEAAGQPCFSRSRQSTAHPVVFLEINDEPMVPSNLLSSHGMFLWKGITLCSRAGKLSMGGRR